MANNTRRSRVPDIKLEPAHHEFLDGIDKRQQRVADIEDLAASPTNAELATAINSILQAHRTR
jgi:hypothetical protein